MGVRGYHSARLRGIFVNHLLKPSGALVFAAAVALLAGCESMRS
jgi:hypothetical protein